MGVKIVYTVSKQGTIEAHEVPSDLDLDDPCLTHCYLGKDAAIKLARIHARRARDQARKDGNSTSLGLAQYCEMLDAHPDEVIVQAQAQRAAK